MHRTFVFTLPLKVFYAMMYKIRASVEILAVFALPLKLTPHGQIGQGQLEDGHDLILAVVQLVHRPLLGCQILQSA